MSENESKETDKLQKKVGDWTGNREQEAKDAAKKAEDKTKKP
jgi:hypothetical protein